MSRALYGLRIRQPIGGDFGFSGELARHYLSRDVWDTEVARYGIDIWMTTTALTDGFKICQSYLGAKIHDAKDPSVALSTMLYQVACSLFGLMETNYSAWSQVNGSRPPPTFGFRYEVGLEPVYVNLERMVNNFKQGLRDLEPIWERVLAPKTMEGVHPLVGQAAEVFRFPEEIWARVVYDYGLAFHSRLIHREHLIKSMTPLYLGRVASFVNETSAASHQEVEERIEAVCQRFEELKPYLFERWR